MNTPSPRLLEALRALIEDVATKVAGVGKSVSQLSNGLSALSAGVAAAAPVVFDTPGAFVSSTGRVRIRASMTVLGTGATTVAGEQVQFALRAGGALIPLGPIINQEMSATHNLAGATMVFDLTGVTVGGAGQTYGIECSNITTPAHTLVVPAEGAFVEVEDMLALS